MHIKVNQEFSFFHLIATKISVDVPEGYNIPILQNICRFEPIITLDGDLVKKFTEKGSKGVYIIFLWLPWQRELFPIYVGSGDIYNRLTAHASLLDRHNKNLRKRKNSTPNITPKYFYDLLKIIDAGYWMVSWSVCGNFKYYENEIYHLLNKTPYLINARATIKDDRSYLKRQKEVAKERFNNISEQFLSYANLYC